VEVAHLEVNSLDDASVVKAGDTKNSSCGNLWWVGKGCFSCVLVEDQWHFLGLLMTVGAQSYYLSHQILLRGMDCLYVQVMELHFHFLNGQEKEMHDGRAENLFLENALDDQEDSYFH
jgi:hypothetical protein